MTKVYHETEHQELFHLKANVHRPIAVHIPSALAKLGYFVCLRVRQAHASQIKGVTTSMKITGRRPTDQTLKAGEGFPGPRTIASKAAGQVWQVLCRILAARGEGTLAFQGMPKPIKHAHVLLCTWLRFVESGQADDYIECQADPAWAPNGVPLGGIGCGKVEICRDGRFRNFSANNNQDMPLEDPTGLEGAYLSIAESGSQSVLAGRTVAGIRPCPNLRAELSFPQARLRARGVLTGIDAEVLLSGPIIPHDIETSCLPGCLVRWTVRNRSNRRRIVRCRLAWPNLVGLGGGIGEPEKRIGYGDGYYRYWDAPPAQRVRVVKGKGFVALRYGNKPCQVSPAADGHHFLAAATGGGRIIPHAHRRRGSIACELTIPPGARASTDMALVWEMPHWIDSLGVDRGHYWQNFHAGGMEILEHLFGNADAIFAGAGELHDLIRRTDLPRWLKRRLVNCCYPLVTNSVFYRDGRFSISEGPTEMGGCYGTLDQRLGAHPATQLLFPQLNRRELELFGECQSPDGGVNHDLGGGHLERGSSPVDWPDLTCSFVIQNASHAWSTGDADFEKLAYERCRKALLRHATWAEAGNGLAQLGGALGTSYDSYEYHGSCPYLGTLWIAALLVGRKWAEKFGDADLIARIDALLPAAARRMEEDLWNGQYYRACGGPTGPRNENCHAGMLAGQWFARMLTGRNVLPEERLRSCAKALLKLNGNERFRVPPDEATPRGQAGSEFGWLPYVECFCLAALASLRGKAVLPLWKRMIRYMDGGGKTPCDTRLMYRPATGEPSWGAYYMTAPASWLVYEALLDFRYRPADGVLRLCPQLSGSFPVIHPVFWAIGRHKGRQTSLKIARVLTESLKVCQLELPGRFSAVNLRGERLDRYRDAGAYRRFAVPALALSAGQEIRWTAE